jgi:hypothetical protein
MQRSPQTRGQSITAFIPIPPFLAFVNDLHVVEQEDGHFSATYLHRRITG